MSVVSQSGVIGTSGGKGSRLRLSRAVVNNAEASEKRRSDRRSERERQNKEADRKKLVNDVVEGVAAQQPQVDLTPAVEPIARIEKQIKKMDARINAMQKKIDKQAAEIKHLRSRQIKSFGVQRDDAGLVTKLDVVREGD